MAFVYLKKPKNYEKGSMPIYVRITVDGVPKEIFTGRECDPGIWNVHEQRVIGTKEDTKALNVYLDILQAKVYEAKRQLLGNNKSVTAEQRKNTLKGKTERQYMLMKIFHYHNEQVKKLVGKEFAPATCTRFKTSFEHVHAFLQWKYGVHDMQINALNFEFITEFEFWLKSLRQCGHNTTIKYIADLRKIVNRCVRNNWLASGCFLLKGSVLLNNLALLNRQGFILHSARGTCNQGLVSRR